MKTTMLGAIASTALALSICAGSNAATIACPANIADNVANTSTCEYSNVANQDFLNTDPITVNAEEFFGFDDWAFVSKQDGVNSKSGTWSVQASVWDMYNQVMAVFKSGNDTTLVGYLLNDGATSGNWTTPFENPPFDIKSPKDVSHISFYGRNEAQVPEPGSLSLLAAGLLGLVAARRRARRN